MKKLFLVVLLGTTFTCQTVCAQESAEIKILIEDGWKAYTEKSYISGAEKLEKAASLMRGLRLENLKPFLPSAPEGWTEKMDDKGTEAAGIGGAMLGGMSMLSRKFTKNTEAVEVKMVTDSPLFTSIVTMLKLMPAGTEGGQGFEKYKTFYAQFEQKDGKAQYNIFDENGLAVTIEGVGMTKETAVLFADKIDFDGLLNAIKN